MVLVKNSSESVMKLSWGPYNYEIKGGDTLLVPLPVAAAISRRYPDCNIIEKEEIKQILEPEIQNNKLPEEPKEALDEVIEKPKKRGRKSL